MIIKIINYKNVYKAKIVFLKCLCVSMNGKPNTIFLGFLVPYVDYWKYSIVQLF